MNYLKGKSYGNDYSKGTLDELNCPGNPYVLLKEWLKEFSAKSDLELSFVLSTVDKHGMPSSRVVLVKDIDEKGLYFYSNYNSKNDVARFIVIPSTTHRYYETLTFDIDLIPNNAKIYVSWENTQIEFELLTATDEELMRYIDESLLTKKNPHSLCLNPLQNSYQVL